MMQRMVSMGRLFRPWAVVCVFAALVWASVICPGRSDAADRSATQHADVLHWVDELSSPLPSARESAYRHLTRLRREELVPLRDAVRDRLSSLAGQQDMLQDIVIQVYLATEPYPSDPRHGFLGVKFDLDQGVKYEPDFYEETPYSGVEIRHLIPGLTASRYLEEGDVILRIQAGERVLEPQRAEELQDLVLELPSGTHLSMLVQRRGRVLQTELVLGGRPRALDDNRDLDLAQFAGERATDAEAYWEEHFQPLFAPAPTSRAAVDVIQ